MKVICIGVTVFTLSEMVLGRYTGQYPPPTPESTATDDITVEGTSDPWIPIVPLPTEGINVELRYFAVRSAGASNSSGEEGRRHDNPYGCPTDEGKCFDYCYGEGSIGGYCGGADHATCICFKRPNGSLA
ncbi:uncharacterized protein LOC125942746 [Dermacentor silvarum]|uniref:uncharacterized protein LOC125942746 n=1 Tax=Dermacentor silvarum TaxID=543639 RepID=UPI00210108DA|nr:uncharacterized protein LOC125942746 [Dermacentor silvarum]